eukprot:scaffold69095_cov61-Phaeocystis_antarctica.AAC.3
MPQPPDDSPRAARKPTGGALECSQIRAPQRPRTPGHRGPQRPRTPGHRGPQRPRTPGHRGPQRPRTLG